MLMKENNQIDYGYSSLTIRNRFFSFRLPIKILTVSLILVILGVCAATAAATLGDFPITLSQVIQAIAGVGEEFHVLIVREWRLPVAIAAVVFGALLGLGGAIFQSLTPNPLGSPDIIGFDAGYRHNPVLGHRRRRHCRRCYHGLRGLYLVVAQRCPGVPPHRCRHWCLRRADLHHFLSDYSC